jgi:hypothetical protein
VLEVEEVLPLSDDLVSLFLLSLFDSVFDSLFASAGDLALLSLLASPFLPLPAKSVTYQPDPLSWKEVFEISLLTLLLQVGHFANGLSVIR